MATREVAAEGRRSFFLLGEREVFRRTAGVRYQGCPSIGASSREYLSPSRIRSLLCPLSRSTSTPVRRCVFPTPAIPRAWWRATWFLRTPRHPFFVAGAV